MTEQVSRKLQKHDNCNEKFIFNGLEQRLPANCVLYVRQVTFLVEGARTLITYNQLFATFTDAALVVVILIILTRQEL